MHIKHTLREANIARAEIWNRNTPPPLMFREAELLGEIGEVANVVKKMYREEQGWVGSRATRDDLAAELADVVICVDLIGMDLGLRPAKPSGYSPGTDLELARELGVVYAIFVSPPDRTRYREVCLGDIVRGCVAIARNNNIDLNAAVEAKFNETSKKNDLPVRLDFNA